MRVPAGVLVLAALCAAPGCGKPPPGPPPAPPRVNLVAPSSNVADTKLALDLSVSGCDEVTSVELRDRSTLVGSVPFSGNPTHLELPPNSFQYEKIAADLSLTAKVACADGRVATSNPVAVRFFPVAEVLESTSGGQLVTDVFTAEGQGPNVGFLGCNHNADGTTSIVRVDRSGAVVAFNNSLPFACSNNTWFTDRNVASGYRWAVEPGVGALALDPLLNVTAYVLGPVSALGVGPDGDAVLYLGGSGQSVLERVSFKDGTVKWQFRTDGVVIANPTAQSTFGVYAPLFIQGVAQTQGTIAVQQLDYEKGTDAGRHELKQITWGLGDAPPIPPAAFNADGSLLYFAFQPQQGTSIVIACSTNATGCAGSGLRWQSPALPAAVVAELPYSNGSILAAIAPQATWFLDASTGAVLNKDGVALSPEGALYTVAVQPGRGGDFYLLNGTGAPGSLPVEVVAVDSPQSGELFRYSVDGASLMAGVDEGGQLWLRVGPDLVRPLPLSEYELVVKR